MDAWLWDGICFRTAAQFIPGIQWEGSEHEQEVQETLGQLGLVGVRIITFIISYSSHQTFKPSRCFWIYLTFVFVRKQGVDGDKWPEFNPENVYVTVDTNLPKKKTMFKANLCYFWEKLHTHTHLSCPDKMGEYIPRFCQDFVRFHVRK